MTCTDQQIGLLMTYKNRYPLTIAAAKSGVSEKTARKYITSGKVPSEQKKMRKHRTRKDPFEQHTQEIRDLYEKAPELQGHTILEYLIEKYPETYNQSHSRTLRRRLRVLRAEMGRDQEIIFAQNIQPGRQSQSDWTCMNSLAIHIAGSPFPHLLFHFMLPYSRWESVMICHVESFLTLTQGCERAYQQLGGTLEEHRTDNLSAATKKAGSSRQFTDRWQEFCNHYGIRPSLNNPGISHENGSVEKSHDLLKKAIDQHLLLRGSRHFDSMEDYAVFLNRIVLKRNEKRKERLLTEIEFLKPLPEKKYNAHEVIPVRVNSLSLIRLKGVTYSVPSRLIGFELIAHVYHERIELYYNHKKLEEMTRENKGQKIDYRHWIDHLIRKPKAFEHYKYKECFFPQISFRKAYECLKDKSPANGDKLYLKLLQLAKLHGEGAVVAALEILQEEGIPPFPEKVKDLLDAPLKPVYDVYVCAPSLGIYDDLLTFQEGRQTCH